MLCNDGESLLALHSLNILSAFCEVANFVMLFSLLRLIANAQERFSGLEFESDFC